jgi:Clostripain family
MTEKDWTIMVYMAGDNNLSEDMVTGLIGMREKFQVPRGNKFSFLAFYDNEALGFPSVMCDFSDKDRHFFYDVPDEKEAVFKFVDWCINERDHKDTNYALIFSGHGDGFLQNAFMRDNAPFSYITPRGLRKALGRIQTEILNGEKLNIIGFDSCVMSSLEAAYEMAGFAETLVASQGYVPNSGWDYAKIVKQVNREYIQLLADGKQPNEAVADIIVESLIEANFDYAQLSGRSIDASWSDLSEIGKVAQMVYDLGNCLVASLKDDSLRIKLEQAVLMAHFQGQTYLYEQCIDIVDFCENLQKCCDESLKAVSDCCDAVIKAVKTCVKNTLTLGPEFQFSNGLSLFFPWSYLSYLYLVRSNYRRLDFAIGNRPIDEEHTRRGSGWTEFLEKYLFDTMRNPKANPTKLIDSKNYLLDYDGETINPDSREVFEVLPTYGTLLKTSHRSDPPNRPRSDPPNRPRGGTSIPDGFKYTKNFPWTPRYWDISESAAKVVKKIRHVQNDRQNDEPKEDR